MAGGRVGRHFGDLPPRIDRLFAPVVDAVMTRARLTPGERVLDLGTGTGAVAERAAEVVGPGGHVVGVDISTQMLALARARVAARGWAHVTMAEGRAEAIPADDNSFDVVLASLSLMYAIDRDAAAREMARVLRPTVAWWRRCGPGPTTATSSGFSRPPAASRGRRRRPASAPARWPIRTLSSTARCGRHRGTSRAGSPWF